MVFSSFVFLFYFLPIVLVVYYGLHLVLPCAYASPEVVSRLRNRWLLLSSYVFFGWWNLWFIPLIFFVSAVNYYCGEIMSLQEIGSTCRRTALGVAIIVSLSLLGFFKYFNFLQDNVNVVLSWINVGTFQVWHIALPMGISFYTFQSLTYSIDIFRGDVPKARSLADFACYIALFPQLVAGPIVRYDTIAQQLNCRVHTYEKFASGVLLFTMGLAKKVCLANPLGSIADTAFNAQSLATTDAWFGAVAYAFQIYFDFSGYSDMAIGLGRMLGFEFLENFRSPYHANSITDFWRRWHISLSSFLRDYLYIPLGGNRRGNYKTYRNLAIVMLLGGLWHGANWTFMLWGAYHGCWLATERWLRERRLHRPSERINASLITAHSVLGRITRVLGTFVLVLFSWVLFRCVTLADAVRYFGWMFSLAPTEAGPSSLIAAQLYACWELVVMLLALAIVASKTRAFDWSTEVTWPKVVLALPILASTIGVMVTQTFNPFLYFQF